ncbi:hypothetical protein Scep_023766 [Stephania cephalantha]|uniref:Uncharacterized protein n=1 Tax=Stephania cephalantha TaxID=152367 RepID=A0AAP0HXM7_9MAGN
MGEGGIEIAWNAQKEACLHSEIFQDWREGRMEKRRWTENPQNPLQGQISNFEEYTIITEVLDKIAGSSLEGSTAPFHGVGGNGDDTNMEAKFICAPYKSSPIPVTTGDTTLVLSSLGIVTIDAKMFAHCSMYGIMMHPQFILLYFPYNNHSIGQVGPNVFIRFGGT